MMRRRALAGYLGRALRAAEEPTSWGRGPSLLHEFCQRAAGPPASPSGPFPSLSRRWMTLGALITGDHSADGRGHAFWNVGEAKAAARNSATAPSPELGPSPQAAPAPPLGPRGGLGELLENGSRAKKLVAVQIQVGPTSLRAFHVALRKSELAIETGLALRDLRPVDSTFQNQIPTVLARPRAIVMSLAHVKAIILRNSVFIFNLDSRRVRQRLIPQVLRRLKYSLAQQSSLAEDVGPAASRALDPHSAPGAVHPVVPLCGEPEQPKADDVLCEALGKGPQGPCMSAAGSSEGREESDAEGMQERDGGWAPPKEQARDLVSPKEGSGKDVFSGGFEFEQSAESAAADSARVSSKLPIVDRTSPVLQCSAGPEADNWQMVVEKVERQEKRIHAEKLGTDVEDAASSKMEWDEASGAAGTDLGKGAETPGPNPHRESIGNAASTQPALPFELQVLEELLDDVDATIRAKFTVVAPQVLQVVQECVGDTRAYELTQEGQQRFLQAKNRMLRLDRGVKQVAEVLEELLGNDEDMAEMYLTRKSELGPGQTNPGDHSELEELLEDYLKRVEEVGSEVETLNLTVDATAQYMRTALDSARNKLIRLDLMVNMATCSLAVGASVAAVFGMNLHSSLEEHPLAFLIVSGSVVASSAVIFGALAIYARRRRIL